MTGRDTSKHLGAAYHRVRAVPPIAPVAPSHGPVFLLDRKVPGVMTGGPPEMLVEPGAGKTPGGGHE
jgi:hypothetical protein